MSRFAKRLTALLLSGMLVIGSAPVRGFAAEPGQTSEAAEESAEEIEEEQGFSRGTDAPTEETVGNQVVIGDTAAPAEETAQYYTVTLDANGGYFANEWDDVLGETVENTEVLNKNIPIGGIVEIVPVKDSATFLGWSLELDGEVLGAEYAPMENCTLYAAWQMEDGVTEGETTEDVSAVDEVPAEDGDPVEDVIVEEMPGEETDVQETLDEGDVQEAEYVDDVEQIDAERDTEVAADSETDEMDSTQNTETAEVEETDAQYNAEETAQVTWEAQEPEPENDEAEESAAASQVRDTEAKGQDATPDQDETATIDAGEESVSTDAAMEVVASGWCGDNLSWTLDDAGTLTISGTGEMTNSPWRSDYGDEITQVVIESGVTTIGGYAFCYCSSLTSVIIPDSVTSIGDDAFFNTPWMNSLGDFCITNGLLFAYRGDGGSITIPNNVTSIGDRVFSDCTSLTSITLPDSVTSIGDRAFYNCSSLTSVTIPDSVTSIGEYAFYCCRSLTSVTIPDSVTSIGEYVFYCCSSLTSVTIPASVTSIGESAFGGCSSILDFTVEPGNPEYNSIDGVLLNNDHTKLIQYPSGRNGEYIIPDGVTSIENCAFGDCSSRLTSVTIPASVTSIGESAFEGCISLTSITIPASVTSIGEYAFYCCSSLASVTIPNSVTSIGRSAFNRCSSLASVTIPNSVTSIEGFTFSECSSLTTVTILEGVTSIGENAFMECSSLTSVTIPDSVTSIGAAAFEVCSSLTNVMIPEGVTSIGSYAFAYCRNLTSMTIPASVTSIGGDAFIYCSDKLVFYGVPGSYAEQYTQSSYITFIDIHARPISRASATIPVQTYTGKALTPDPAVKMDGITLTKDTDYAVSYTDNVNAGTAAVTIIGMGDYTGSTTVSFEIKPASVSKASVSGLSDTTYNGRAQTPAPVVKLGSTTLKANTDYTVSYKNNKYAGTATVTITGKGNYTGTKTATFKINKANQTITAKSSASSVAVGKTATISISSAKGTKSFKSLNTAIATVTSTGKLTAKKVGTVKITATSAATSNFNAASKTVTIKVVSAATTSLTAANQATGIKLTWKKVTGATGFLVYRDSTKIATIKSGSTVTYTDNKANTNGTKYTYKIIPTASTGNGLAKSVTTYCVARPAISSVTNSASKRMTVKWGKNAKASGYQIHYCMDKTFKTGNKSVSVTSAGTVAKAIASLTKGKTYYVRIRTYKTVGSTKYFSAWSPVKSVKISK